VICGTFGWLRAPPTTCAISFLLVDGALRLVEFELLVISLVSFLIKAQIRVIGLHHYGIDCRLLAPAAVLAAISIC